MTIEEFMKEWETTKQAIDRIFSEDALIKEEFSNFGHELQKIFEKGNDIHE